MNFAVVDVGEETLFLRFTTQAYAEVQEKFGSVPKAFEILTSSNINDLMELVEILARNGELSRRYLGYDKGHIFTKTELMTVLQINDVPQIREAVTNCILDGVGDKKQEKPVDLGLVQLNKEKSLDMSILYRAALSMGMSLKELYMTPIGQVFDMMEAKNGN